MKTGLLYTAVILTTLILLALSWWAYFDGQILKSAFFGLLTFAAAVTGYRTLNRKSLMEKRKND